MGLLIRYFFPRINTIMTGIEQMQEQAMSSPHSLISLKARLKTVRPTASVRILSVFVTIRGHIKLFQVVTNVNILRVAIAGMAQGITMRENV